jgi:hypothetical protein
MQVMKDLLYIFFKLKYFPDNYGVCRLWEMDRKQWSYYYGSSYHPFQRAKLRKEVQPYEYLILFDDKEICEMLCRGINVKLPKYYGAISPGMDYINEIKKIIKTTDKRIIIKPVRGQAGQGIAIAYREGDSYVIREKQKEYRLEDFKLIDRSIIQEVIEQNSEIAKISSTSVNTIRVVTLYTRSDEVIVISANMRFGVGKSYVDNVSAGGIHVGVDYATGTLKKLAYDKHGNRLTEHPTTGVKFEGYKIPHWNEVKQMALNVQKSFPFYKLLGLDVALTDEGPVLIEINPNADLVFQEQGAGPILADARVREEFNKYDLLINKYQKALVSEKL